MISGDPEKVTVLLSIEGWRGGGCVTPKPSTVGGIAGVSHGAPLSHAARASRKCAVNELDGSGGGTVVASTADMLTECLSLLVDDEVGVNKRRRQVVVSTAVDRRMLQTEDFDKVSEIWIYTVNQGMMVLLGGDRFTSSPLIRKIGVLSDDGKELRVTLDSNGDVLTALQIASRTILKNPEELFIWLDAWDYLLIPPPLELIYNVTKSTLLTIATMVHDEFPLPLRSRFREVGNRGFFDVATGELPGGAAPDAPRGDLGRRIVLHEGYNLLQPPSPLEDASPRDLEEEVRKEDQLQPRIGNIIKATKAIGLLVHCFGSNSDDYIDSIVEEPLLRRATQLLIQEVLNKCIKTVAGAKIYIRERCFSGREGTSTATAMSVLYSAECRGRPDCSLTIEAVASYRDAIPSKFEQIGRYLPITFKDQLVILPIRKRLPVRTPPRKPVDIISQLSRLAPWVPEVLCPGKLWITGSLLSEILEGPEALEFASDVDLFCAVEDLESLFEVVLQAMLRYGKSLGIAASLVTVRVSESKWRLEFPVEAAKHHRAATKCDLYVNSIEKVRRYHLPLVRAAFDGEIATIYPSCAIALGTRVNVDYEYVAGSKSPFSIVYKMWLRGFTLFVSNREQRQMLEYARENLSSEDWIKKTRGSTDFIAMTSPRSTTSTSRTDA
jgi:hypothetical protein